MTITNEVLKNLGSDLVDNRPTVQNPVLIDSNKGVIWTYHPNYLNKSHLKDEVIQKVLTEENADCKTLLTDADYKFQKNFLDNE